VSRSTTEYDKVTWALARNRLGAFPIILFVASAAAPLTVVAGAVTTGWAVTGVAGIPIAYAAVAAVLGVFSVGYTAMARQIRNAGAFYAYISRGLGGVAGLGGAAVALVAYSCMQISLYGAIGAVSAGLVDDRYDGGIPWWIYALAAWAVVGLLGVMRIDLHGVVLGVLLLAEVGVAVGFAAVGVAHPADGTVTLSTLSPSWLTAGGIGAGLALAVTSYVGIEATVVYSEEARNPGRTVRRATFWSVAVIGLLYAAISWAMSVAAGPDQVVDRARAEGTEMMFLLVAPYVHPVWVDLGHMLFVTSLFAAALAFHNTVARYAFALGRERVAPAWLGRTGPRSGAPKWASVTQTAVAGVVIIVFAANGFDPIVHLFFWGGMLGGLGVLLLMTTTSIAVVAYFARRGVGADPEDRVGVWSRVIAPVSAAVALLGVLWLTVSQFDVLLGVTDTLSPWPVVLPMVYVWVALAGVLWGVFFRRWRPDTYARIGMGAYSAIVAAPKPSAHAVGVR